MVAKYADHQPLYRQEEIFGCAGFPIPRSTQGQWVGAGGVKLMPLYELMMKSLLLERSVPHADETPVPMLKPGLKRTHRAYLWAYGTPQYDPEQMVVYDFAEGRGGEYARNFLGSWQGALGRANWLFAGSARAGHRAAVVMSLIQSARLNDHDPCKYLRDVLERLPVMPEPQLEALLPHVWKPADAGRVH